jgi:hypothetical protein
LAAVQLRRRIFGARAYRHNKKNNERATSFRITALEKDAIVGRHERISYDDILRVNARKTDDFKDTAMTILLTTAAVVVYVGMKVLEAESESEY